MAFSLSVVNRSGIDTDEATNIGTADVARDVFDALFLKTVLANPKVVEVLKEEAGANRYELVEVVLVVQGRL